MPLDSYFDKKHAVTSSTAQISSGATMGRRPCAAGWSALESEAPHGDQEEDQRQAEHVGKRLPDIGRAAVLEHHGVVGDMGLRLRGETADGCQHGFPTIHGVDR